MASLLSLPAVVWSEILDCLDLHNLKKLRCVCKQTKDMVEQSKYLQKFQITLKTVKCQEIVLSSTVHWNNFLLVLKGHVLPGFLTQYGKFIQHLEVRNVFAIDIPIILSHLGPQIQTLIIESALMNPYTFQSPIWAKNFVKLNKLQIGGIMNFPDAPKTLFEIILDNCTSCLTHLTIPGLMQSDKSSTTEVHYTNLIFQPVLNYLKRIESSQVESRLIIDFMSGWMEEPFKCRAVAEMQLNPEILFSMVQISSRIGVSLLHVPLPGFPMDKRSLTIEHRQMFEKSIVSVVKTMDKEKESIQSMVELNKNRYTPKNTQIHIRFLMTHRRDENYNGFELRGPIHALEIFSPHFPSFRHPYQQIFQTQRPTVQKLELCWFMNRVERQVMDFGKDVSFSFPNLKDLCISHCDGIFSKDYNAMFLGLPTLEKLKIENSNLFDEGVFGDDDDDYSRVYTHPVILKLNRLNHLELLLCGHLTNLSFTKAFRHMKLQTFKWTNGIGRYCKVTFAEGISSLCSIDGGFKDSVQCLGFESPGDCSRKDVDEFVNKFTSLKYFKMGR